MGGIPGVANKKLKQALAMRRSPRGWSYDAVVGVLRAFGFEMREGKEHTICFDPDDKQNVVSVPRHREVRGYVVEQSLVVIERRLAKRGMSLDGA